METKTNDIKRTTEKGNKTNAAIQKSNPKRQANEENPKKLKTNMKSRTKT